MSATGLCRQCLTGSSVAYGTLFYHLFLVKKNTAKMYKSTFTKQFCWNLIWFARLFQPNPKSEPHETVVFFPHMVNHHEQKYWKTRKIQEIQYIPSQNDKTRWTKLQKYDNHKSQVLSTFFKPFIFLFTFSKAFLSGTFSEMFPSLPRWPRDAATAIGPIDDLLIHVGTNKNMEIF